MYEDSSDLLKQCSQDNVIWYHLDTSLLNYLWSIKIHSSIKKLLELFYPLSKCHRIEMFVRLRVHRFVQMSGHLAQCVSIICGFSTNVLINLQYFGSLTWYNLDLSHCTYFDGSGYSFVILPNLICRSIHFNNISYEQVVICTCTRVLL